MKQSGQRAAIHEVMATLRDIPDYDVHAWLVNTADFGLPQNRKRIYIVGVNLRKTTLRLPLEEWGPFLEALKLGQPQAVHDFLLDDTEPEVMDAARRRHMQARLRHQIQVSAAAARCLGRPLRASSLGVGGAQSYRIRGLGWTRRHNQLRRQLGLGDATPVTGDGRGWTSYLSTRERDVLELCAVRLEKRLSAAGALPAPTSAHAVAAAETTFCSEISRGVDYSSHFLGIAPCITPSGKLWIWSRWRWAVGVEKMALQGFPVDDLNLEGLSEVEIADLAGNAMSVPVVGAMLLLVLAFARYPNEEADGAAAAGPLDAKIGGGGSAEADGEAEADTAAPAVEAAGDADAAMAEADALAEAPREADCGARGDVEAEGSAAGAGGEGGGDAEVEIAEARVAAEALREADCKVPSDGEAEDTGVADAEVPSTPSSV
eukprot:TRINITY_DN6827_c0_g3_i2.p2 TRINITY_DN6827_c0_g3~~TRINITY_DN6827_c0_g3_i2.p2  ORF type:complete len:432 (-),score=118.86 TRINITY_DN6827_c0_g3_i2:58-1353(-)